MKLIIEVSDIANDLIEQTKQKISLSDALTIAVQIQRNRIIEDAFVIGQNAPTALEAIAISLGYKDKIL